MTLMEHLLELRSRVIRAALAVAIGAAVAWTLYPQITNILLNPYQDIVTDQSITGGRLLQTDPLEGFSIRLKIATYGGIALAMPVILWQLWRFVSPGLYSNEKKYAIPFVGSAVLLFATGASIAYWTLPKALNWLISIGGGDLVTAFSPGKYFQLILYMMLAFGICFEIPILLVFLQFAGIVPNRSLRAWRRQAAVVVVVVVAVATPSADPVSLLALSVPLMILYELSIQIGRLREVRRGKADRVDAPG